MKYCALLPILIILTSCVVKAPVVESSGFSRDAPMMWSSGFPKEIRISKDFDDGKVTSIANMARSWNAAADKTFYSIGAPLEKLTSETNLASFDTDGIFGIYSVHPNDMPNAGHRGASSTIAVTLLKIQTQNYKKSNEYNQIFFADIYVKNNIPFRVSGTSDQLSYDLNSVMVHEFGHALGLEHAYNKTGEDSVMVESINTEYNKNAPLPFDTENIKNKYGLTTTQARQGSFGIARPDYVPDTQKNKPFVRLIIELRSDGECIHSADGEIIKSHKRHLD